LNLPQLTEERRKDLVKVVHARVEEAHVAVRNIRRDAMKDIREFKDEKLIGEDDEKRAEEETQKLTDEIIKELDRLGAAKEKDVMEV
jgi:ribosome recycling factor